MPLWNGLKVNPLAPKPKVVVIAITEIYSVKVGDKGKDSLILQGVLLMKIDGVQR